MGINLMGDYNTTSSTGIEIPAGTPITFFSRSGPRSFLVGPALEFGAMNDFSLEVDSVYRPLRQHYIETSGAGSFSGDASVITWQFPVLAKYKLVSPLFGNGPKPFLEAGPSFRIGDSATHFGFTAGAGISVHLGPLNIGPAVRYTRWQADPLGYVRANEANLLVGITF